MMNQSESYDVYSEYYDSIVSERRDFVAIAKALADLIGDRQRILEIGVGTGLVIEKLIQTRAGHYEIWGIDNSQPLLEQAKSKLKNFEQVHLYLCDVLDFNLRQAFEAIYSRGGPFFVIAKDRERFFASHLLDRKDNLKALVNVKQHLQENGLLLLSIVDFKHDEERALESGVIYRRQTDIQVEDNLKKLTITLAFEKAGTTIGNQEINLSLMSVDEYSAMFADAGLKLKEISPDNQYLIYTKA